MGRKKLIDLDAEPLQQRLLESELNAGLHGRVDGTSRRIPLRAKVEGDTGRAARRQRLLQTAVEGEIVGGNVPQKSARLRERRRRDAERRLRPIPNQRSIPEGVELG